MKERKNKRMPFELEFTAFSSLALIRLQRGEAAPANPNDKRMCSKRGRKKKKTERKTTQRMEAPPKEGSIADKVRQSCACTVCLCTRINCVHVICAFGIYDPGMYHIHGIGRRRRFRSR